MRPRRCGSLPRGGSDSRKQCARVDGVTYRRRLHGVSVGLPTGAAIRSEYSIGAS
jgi:hypothetical protein